MINLVKVKGNTYKVSSTLVNYEFTLWDILNEEYVDPGTAYIGEHTFTLVPGIYKAHGIDGGSNKYFTVFEMPGFDECTGKMISYLMCTSIEDCCKPKDPQIQVRMDKYKDELNKTLRAFYELMVYAVENENNDKVLEKFRGAKFWSDYENGVDNGYTDPKRLFTKLEDYIARCGCTDDSNDINFECHDN